MMAGSRNLSEEVGAWGWLAPYAGRGSGDALVEDTDPFARLDGKTSAEFYRAAEANCMPLAYGRQAVENRILAEGWVIEPGKAGGKDARDLADWAQAWLARRSLRFTAALPLLTSYLFYGWHPYNVTWEDWTWSRSSGASGKRSKVPARVIDKDGRMFRFNVARNLVYTGFGAGQEVFPIAEKGPAGDEARMRWLTPRRGSEDVPYGRGIYRTSGAAAAYLIWRDLWPQWQRGVDRSMGVLLIERTVSDIASQLGNDELETQLGKMLEVLNSTGVLSPPAGYSPKWMENTKSYAEGWKDPLDRLEALIALSVTGQGLSIGMGRGGSSGSRAAAEVEEGRSARWGRGYAQDLAETVTNLVDLAVEWNHGDVPDDLRPNFVFRSQRQIDAEKLQAYVDLFSGDPNASPPDADVISDDWGIPTREGGEWGREPVELPDMPAVSEEDDIREEPEEESEAA